MHHNSIDGRRVRQLREARGWTQQDLGSKADLDQGTVSRIELGRSTRIYVATLEKLAEVFDCTADELLTTSKTRHPLVGSPGEEYTVGTLAGWQLPEWDELTPDEREDVKQFVAFVLSRRRRRGGEEG